MIYGHWADKAGGLVALGGSYAPGAQKAAQAKRRQAIDKATAQAVKDFRALWASLAELGAVYDVTLAPGAANYLANLRASLAATAEGLRLTGVDIPR